MSKKKTHPSNALDANAAPAPNNALDANAAPPALNNRAPVADADRKRSKMSFERRLAVALSSIIADADKTGTTLESITPEIRALAEKSNAKTFEGVEEKLKNARTRLEKLGSSGTPEDYIKIGQEIRRLQNHKSRIEKTALGATATPPTA